MPASLRSRLLLAVPAALLVSAAAALPASADPGGVPNGGNSDAAHAATADKAAAKASAKPKPKKPHAPNSHAATPAKGKSATAPNNGKKKPHPPTGNGKKKPHPPTGNGNGAPAPGNPAPGTNNGSKLGKVVICKYVRKPGAAEVPSHVIVVNANALVGKGFDGVFPHAFSDGQLKSVAIRWAAKGESAREISLSECGAAAATVVAPDPVTANGPAPAEAAPGAPGTVVDKAVTADQVGDVTVSASRPGSSSEPKRADGLLPSTGAGAALLALLVAGAACLVGGGTVLLRHRLRRDVAGT